MSITVRLWSKEDLKNLQHDKWLATIFMNRSTFSQEEIKYYPYNLRREYVAIWHEENERITFYATDDEMAIRFLKAEYTQLPVILREITYKARQVKIS